VRRRRQPAPEQITRSTRSDSLTFQPTASITTFCSENADKAKDSIAKIIAIGTILFMDASGSETLTSSELQLLQHEKKATKPLCINLSFGKQNAFVA
jgi:hypothetical protein